MTTHRNYILGIVQAPMQDANSAAGLTPCEGRIRELWGGGLSRCLHFGYLNGIIVLPAHRHCVQGKHLMKN